MSGSLNEQVRRLRRQAHRAAFLGSLARHGAVALLLAGVAALLFRLLLDVPRATALWCLLAVVPALFTAWWTSRKRVLSERGAATWLDVHSGSTGFLVTELEAADPAWSERVETVARTASGPPRFQKKHILRPVTPAVAFVVAAFAVDVSSAALVNAPFGFVENAVDEVREKLATLEETVELDEELAEELEERLQRLEEEADPDRPESTFEAIDRLDERLGQEAERVQEIAEQGLQELTQLSQFAQTENADSESIQAAMEEILQELSENGLTEKMPPSLKELLDNLDLDLSGLDVSGLQLPEGVSLDPSKWSELSEELREMLKNQLGDLAAAGLLELGNLGELGNLADLPPLDGSRLAPHECDECKAGGT